MARSQKTLMTALKAQNTKTRVAAENMANSSSADYVPKTVYIGSRHNRKSNTTDVNVKNIKRDQKKVKKVFYSSSNFRRNISFFFGFPYINEKGSCFLATSAFLLSGFNALICSLKASLVDATCIKPLR